MSVTDANPPHPTFVDDYVLHQVDNEWLEAAVKPKQFIHIDQSECIMCDCLLYTSPSPRDQRGSRMPSSA